MPRRTGGARELSSLVAPAAVLLVLLLLMMIARREALGSPVSLNPDEAELMADGRRALLNLIPYATYTTPTYVYLWPTLMGVLARVGMPLTLSAAHVLSGLAYVLMAFGCWHVLRSRLGALMGSGVVIPAGLVMFAGPMKSDWLHARFGDAVLVQPPDFLSLGTELLGVVIVVAAAAVLCAGRTAPTVKRLAFAAFLSGLSIWAKLQVAPLAVGFVVAGVLLATAREPTRAPWLPRLARNAGVAAICFLLPSMLSVGVLALSGTLYQFWQEPMHVTFAYVAHRSASSNGVSPPLLQRVEIASAWAFVALPAYLFALAGLSAATGRAPSARWLKILVWLIPLGAGLVTLLFSFPIYTHYLNIVFASAMVSGMLGATVGSTDPAGHTRLGKGPALPVLSAGLLVMAAWLPRAVSPEITGNPLPQKDTAAVGAICPAHSTVLVWGWSAELYADFDWVPSSRYVINTYQTLASGNQAYFRDVLAAEMRSAPPRCIVEPSGPNFFASRYFPPIETVEPQIATLLASCYEPPRPAPHLDGTVFVRKQSCRQDQEH